MPTSVNNVVSAFATGEKQQEQVKLVSLPKKKHTNSCCSSLCGCISVPDCQPNAHYEPEANSCPNTCQFPDIAPRCNKPKVAGMAAESRHKVADEHVSFCAKTPTFC